jgi:hypothetical protein
MITSDGIGIQADCKAIRRKTTEYAAPAERPRSRAVSLVIILFSIAVALSIPLHPAAGAFVSIEACLKP